MAQKINLLPQDLSVSTQTLKLAGVVRRVAYAAVSVFIFSVIIASAYLLFLNTQLTNLKRDNEGLVTQIKNLEDTEQAFILIKDRLKKASQVRTSSEIKEKVTFLEGLVTNLGAGLTLSEAELDQGKISLTATAASSGSIAPFFALLTSNRELFEKIILKNFGFNSASGYLINLEII